MKQNISLGKKKSAPYPTKTSINLIKSETSKQSTVTTFALFLVFLVILAIFTKFAVIDPLASGIESSHAVNEAQDELNSLKLSNANYSELSDQYSRYIVSGLTDAEKNRVNRDDVIKLVTERFAGQTLSTIKLVDNTLSVSCNNMNLQQASELVQALEQDERVSYVTVSTATEREGKAAAATFDITMKGANNG